MAMGPQFRSFPTCKGWPFVCGTSRTNSKMHTIRRNKKKTAKPDRWQLTVNGKIDLLTIFCFCSQLFTLGLCCVFFSVHLFVCSAISEVNCLHEDINHRATTPYTTPARITELFYCRQTNEQTKYEINLSLSSKLNNLRTEGFPDLAVHSNHSATT